MSAVMRYWVLSVAVLLGATLVTDCLAQGPGGGGRGGRGGFGFGGRGGGGGGIAGLLRIDEVKAELKATDEQVEEINKLGEEARAGIDFSNFGEMSDEERTKAFKSIQEASDKVDAQLAEVLDPNQFKRLVGLYAQRSGAAALANKQVAAQIGLSDETVAKLTAKRDEISTKQQEEFRNAFQNGGGGGGGGGDFRERIEKSRKEMDDALFALVSDDEKKKFEELKGEKFEFPQFGPGGGRGGRGGERRGGNNNN